MTSVSDLTKTSDEGEKLTDTQRVRIERNRQKALLLRQTRVAKEPYPKSKPSRKVAKTSKEKDTGGGFFLEEDEELDPKKVVHPAAPLIDPSIQLCDDCGKPFIESYLNDNYDVNICNKCREENEHKLITRTEAKNKYLLKDVDFDSREPPLKFILKKNPRDDRWGSMKLYLESQIKERALLVWNDMESIEEEKERRGEKRQESKQKHFDKKLKDLRMTVRSSLWKKERSVHEHDYGPEMYDEETDMYKKTCQSCDHCLEYEKM